jgi:hypothetical protein
MRTRRLIPLLAAAASLALVTPVPAQNTSRCLAVPAIPSAVRPFVAARTCALAVASADLDRDGRADYALVVQRQDTVPEEGYRRALLVIIAADSGRFRLAARSDRVILCSRCGGVWGDPYDTLLVERGSLTVHHFGGAGWRWRTEYRFDYSRRDRAWQLVKATEVGFHSGDPEGTLEMHVYRPPRDYGKIDLRQFDPQDYRGHGPR